MEETDCRVEKEEEEPDESDIELVEVGDYQILRSLGKGTFSIVKLGVHKPSGKKVAMKFINQKATKREIIDKEIRVMRMVDHPNVIKLFEVIELPDIERTCLVMEYAAGGEIFDLIVISHRLSEKMAAKIFWQLLSAVEHLHSLGIVHRDIKAENLLLDTRGNVKLSDFGLSCIMQPNTFMKTNGGSPLYSSPEVIANSPQLGPEIDVWAMGVCLFAMVAGYLPWDGETLTSQIINALCANYEVPDHVSTECQTLISRMLTVDMKNRATIVELKCSSWLNSGLFDQSAAVRRPTSFQPPKKKINASEVDFEILSTLESLGFKRTDVLNDLINDRTTKQSYVFYHLLLEQKEALLEEEAKAPKLSKNSRTASYFRTPKQHKRKKELSRSDMPNLDIPVKDIHNTNRSKIRDMVERMFKKMKDSPKRSKRSSKDEQVAIKKSAVPKSVKKNRSLEKIKYSFDL